MVFLLVFAVFFLFSVHPFLTYPASLRIAAKFARRGNGPAVHGGRSASIAILFCAYNEEAVIAAKLVNCIGLQDADPACRVFVYTDGCSDRTVEIVRSFGDAVHLIEGRERRGKSAGMNQLVRAARSWGAEILFFTDANVMLAPDVLGAMRREFGDATVGCVTGHLDYVNKDESPTASVGARYWSADETLKHLESQSGSCMGADGSIFGIRAALHKDVPENIIDDFFTSMSVLCSGWRCIYSPAVVAFERSATGSSEEYRRKVRIACRAFNCHRLLWPRLRRLGAWNLYKYVSHKLMRWLTGFWLLGAVLSAAAGVIASGLSWGWVIALALAAAGLALAVFQMPGAPWSLGRQVLVAITATAVGVVKSMRGERFQTWSIAATTRQMAATPVSKG